ncbi:hypothetical protein ABB29_13425 [Pseudoxanthomonas dokdonensis]|uniref:Uncharacterized protein n=1 Tax=Pseudoxanthomonas dokdonensis TaxID=344882 RepID=A0A0R0CR18_9GAMM|nr:hypothetical protein ABB29_13425 [Pseudoxanthomonas dokdonensis]
MAGIGARGDERVASDPDGWAEQSADQSTGGIGRDGEHDIAGSQCCWQARQGSGDGDRMAAAVVGAGKRVQQAAFLALSAIVLAGIGGITERMLMATVIDERMDGFVYLSHRGQHRLRQGRHQQRAQHQQVLQWLAAVATSGHA